MKNEINCFLAGEMLCTIERGESGRRGTAHGNLAISLNKGLEVESDGPTRLVIGSLASQRVKADKKTYRTGIPMILGTEGHRTKVRLTLS